MDKTYERKNSTKNGIKRAAFAAIAILIQIIAVVLLLTVLDDYTLIISSVFNIIALVIAIQIYSNQNNIAMKMPLIVIMLLYPALGLALYALIGLGGSTKKMRKQFQGVDSILFAKLPRNEKVWNKMIQKDEGVASISRMIQKEGYPVYEQCDLTYYDNASDGLEAQLVEMRKAKSFIFMEYHAIEDKESWARIEEVLVDRVRNGVEVRIIYDDMGSITFIDTSFEKKMTSLGIQCQAFNPLSPGLNVFYNNRDHRKITVVDGRVGFTGGYNLANEYFNITHPYGMWKDTGIRLEGDAVKSLTVTFLEMWCVVNKNKKIKANAYLPDYKYIPRQSGFVQPYADGPLHRNRLAENVYISLLNKANHYCYFITPYLIITNEMVNAMALASHRGVDVRIITPGIPDKKMVYRVTRSFYGVLVENGVRIYEWSPGFCHAKMCVVDDCMATVGTINLDFRSLYHHFENGCFIYDSPIVYDIKKDFLNTFDECTEVTELYLDKASRPMVFKDQLLRLFAGLL